MVFYLPFQLSGRLRFRAEIVATLVLADINSCRATVLDLVEYFADNKHGMIKELEEKEAQKEQAKAVAAENVVEEERGKVVDPKDIVDEAVEVVETKAAARARIARERKEKLAEEKRAKALEREQKKLQKEKEKEEKLKLKQAKELEKQAKKKDDSPDTDKESTIDKKLGALKIKLKK